MINAIFYNSFILADHHNRFDFTQIDRLMIALFLTCFFLGYIIKKLIKKEDKNV